MWRNLGFFYDLNHKEKAWEISGSHDGINKFIKILKEYSENDKNSKISEHDHFGPYAYLKITTTEEPKMTEDQIGGSLEDIKRLSEIVEIYLQKGEKKFEIDKEYSDKNEYKLIVEVKDDDFDPSSADKAL